MVTFPEFELLGPSIAAMSDKSDGDCGYHADTPQDREQFLRAAGTDPGWCVGLRQVHGNVVLAVDATRAGQGALRADDAPADADGLITNVPGLGLLIGVADCVPVLLYAGDGPAIGALHAGRESTFQNIVGAGVAAMVSHYGIDPKHLHALIGPSISSPAYEVSEEIAARFEGAGLPVHGRCLDLWGANRQQLLAAGVPEDQITVDGRCTRSSHTFHSFRRGQNKQRNLVLLQL
ncbi:MAG: multicopper polyphenol oxidase [Candidatus Hydrogenedens sp.]|nr:multicopper polyphenol oxidase [Candidatus Hydrogenedens sp.]